MLRRPPRSTPLPTRRSSDLLHQARRSRHHSGDHASGAKSDSATGSDFAPDDRKSTRLNSSHTVISYAVFCLKKKKTKTINENKDDTNEYNTIEQLRHVQIKC